MDPREKMYRVGFGVQGEGEYALRHKVFAETLKWIPERADKLDIDDYDCYAFPFTVVQTNGNWREDRLAAYLRVIHYDQPYMLEHEFKDVIPNGFIKSHSMEISRLCINTDVVNHRDRLFVLTKLFNAVIMHGRELGREFCYFVTVPSVITLLRYMKIPVHVLKETPERLSAVVHTRECILLDTPPK